MVWFWVATENRRQVDKGNQGFTDLRVLVPSERTVG